MAINISHQPAGAAIQLANQAGEGQRQRMMAEAQRRADQDYANQVQQALANQQAQSALTLRGNQQQIEANQNTQALAARSQDQNADRALVEQRLQFEQQQAAAKAQQQADLKGSMSAFVQGQGSPQDQAYFNATGKLPETLVPQNATTRQARLDDDFEIRRLKFEESRISSQLDNAQRAEREAVKAAAGISDDPNLVAAKQASAVAKQEYDAVWNALRVRMQTVSQGRQQPQGTPTPAPSAVANQGGAVLRGRDGTVSTLNPKTGEIITARSDDDLQMMLSQMNGTESSFQEQGQGIEPVNIEGSRGELDGANARAFLQMAGGDKQRAKQMAIQAGFSVTER